MELILSSATLDIGRIAINNWYSGSTNIWTANTNGTSWLFSGNSSVGSSTFGFSLGKNNTISSGAYGITLNGLSNTVSNNFATVINGKTNLASGSYSSIVSGTGNTSSGSLSFVGNGKNNISQGTLSVIINGTSNKVSNSHSAILQGRSNNAYSNYSLIGNGYTNRIPNGTSSYTTILNGKNNSVFSNSYHSVILGGFGNILSNAKYAMIFGKSNTITAAYSIAFGNGASTATAKQVVFAAGGGNTVRIDMNAGKLYADDSVTGSPADYSEYFEWEDGNLNNETRFGYSVSLMDNGKIKISNENIIGIVSSNPFVIGDAAELSWNKKHKTDDWGIKLTETFDNVTIFRGEQKISLWIDKNGKQYSNPPRNQKEKFDFFVQDFYELTQEEKDRKQTDMIYLYSEEYNQSTEYIPRSERKEFSAIGLLGKIRVRTAQQIDSKFIDFNSQGMAVNGTQYRVLENIKDYDGQYGIVKVFFK